MAYYRGGGHGGYGYYGGYGFEGGWENEIGQPQHGRTGGARKSAAATRREDEVRRKFDKMRNASEEKVKKRASKTKRTSSTKVTKRKFLLTKGTPHLTSAAFADFCKYVKNFEGWKASQMELTESELAVLKAKDRRNGKMYSVWVSFQADNAMHPDEKDDSSDDEEEVPDDDGGNEEAPATSKKRKSPATISSKKRKVHKG